MYTSIHQISSRIAAQTLHWYKGHTSSHRMDRTAPLIFTRISDGIASPPESHFFPSARWPRWHERACWRQLADNCGGAPLLVGSQILNFIVSKFLFLKYQIPSELAVYQRACLSHFLKTKNKQLALHHHHRKQQQHSSSRGLRTCSDSYPNPFQEQACSVGFVLDALHGLRKGKLPRLKGSKHSRLNALPTTFFGLTMSSHHRHTPCRRYCRR